MITIDYTKFVNNSRLFLKNYILDNKLQSVIIGISGGIDSTVSCAIAYPVCYELDIPLIGRSLSCHSNNPKETSSADLVGDAFCTNYKRISIEKTYAYISDLLEENEGICNLIQEGNIKARLRMIYLRHLASIHKGIVLDNDNFTEWNLGFWTVGGDSPMDVNLGLHYLWKSQIYELADYLRKEIRNKTDNLDVYKKQYKAIIKSIKLIPTDGNGISSSDCEQFELENYKQVDDVLETMYYRSMFEQAFSSNYDQYVRLVDDYGINGVNRIMTLHKNTKFKRKPAPIMPSLEELELVS